MDNLNVVIFRDLYGVCQYEIGNGKKKFVMDEKMKICQRNEVKERRF